ncbi:hypothetical protein [Daejeonella lutea]|uniref:Uncharacterized protein n=1 Tax=Daejeonella lutea TaxID=572036 RepID=A0A1T5ERJ0_9SPHI|nr:hypothetical protein [Daejeonella lutea]SKB86478.1 hypothetical protein SAMN05661099_3153 [Daejeonella lutea]
MELKNNDLIKGSSGRFGDQLVYRQRNGKTIIARRPVKRNTPPSVIQQELREQFSEAVLYAKAVIANEAKKAIYQGKATPYYSAYLLALTDFRKAPEIRKYDTSAYSGQIGDEISVRAIDNFKVERVMLLIKDSLGETIEEGAAVLSENGVDWIYTATVVNPTLPGTTLFISAADIPGNITTEEVTL